MSRTSLVSPSDEVIFPSSVRALAELGHRRADLVSTLVSPEVGGAISYHLRGESPASGPRLVIRTTGHRVLYGEYGRRVLCTDPSGTVLHECEWTQHPDGAVRLARARVRLDSLLWIGLIPEATAHVTTLALPCVDRPNAPDGRSVTSEDLRQMAAQAWRVPLEDVRYFYPDGSFERDAQGRVTIRLKKDGIFLLEDGTFSNPTFISYMGAIPWARIDLLNVVELFQSTLPGTGSAVFELLWGLCDDQRHLHGPIALRYRGLPTYPSEPAYGLFCAFFRPEAPNGGDPHELFMDSNRASQIAWWLRPDPPVRYFDRAQHLAITVQNGLVQKVTVTDDPVGVPYVAPGTHGGFASCERTAVVVQNRLHLRDGGRIYRLPLDPGWGITCETPVRQELTYPFGWRTFFHGRPPSLDPKRVHALALFYPDDETEVAELSTQPFVLEQLYASLNALPDLLSRLTRISRVLIDGFDAVAAGCIDHDYTRSHVVLYRSREWAQKQAQALWDRVALAGKLPAVRETQFLPADCYRKQAYEKEYDLIYCWLPFAIYPESAPCAQMISAVRASLIRNGLAFVVGPQALRALFALHALQVLRAHGVEDLVRLPLMTEHLRLHPRTRLNPALTVFLVEKR